MLVRSFYSKVKPGRLLALVSNALECGETRIDLSPPEEFLQACLLPVNHGQVVKAHFHAPREAAPGNTITQEGWLVMRGRVRVRLFDFDKQVLEEIELAAGQLLINFHAGHSLESIEERTLVLEFKNGPYLGRDFDYF